jgi:hypothetical protein
MMVFMPFIAFLCIIEVISVKQRKEKVEWIFITSISIILSILLITVYTKATRTTEKVIEEEPYAVEHIVALNDTDSIEGKFYMRRGYINESLYYQYMVQLSNGGFKANRVSSDITTLFYADSNYRVEWYRYTQGILYFKSHGTCIEIYIPRGSISEDVYSVDLK